MAKESIVKHIVENDGDVVSREVHANCRLHFGTGSKRRQFLDELNDSA